MAGMSLQPHSKTHDTEQQAKAFRFTMVNLYPQGTLVRYLMSNYLLKGFIEKNYTGDLPIVIEVINFPSNIAVEKLVATIKDTSPNWVGYSCYTWNIELILDVIAQLRSSDNHIHILGGPELSDSRIATFNNPNSGDYYIIGEGEFRLLRLVTALTQNGCYDSSKATLSVPGVSVWQDDHIEMQLDNDVISQLDTIPSIYLNDIIDERLFFRQQALIETQRGCRYKCKYCTYPKLLSTIKYYSLDRILAEIDYLILEKQIKALRFLDAIFTSDKEYAKKIVRHLLELRAKHGITLPVFYWEYNFQDSDEEFISLVGQLKLSDSIRNTNTIKAKDTPQHYSELVAGYSAVNSVGLQSFHQPSLRAMGRPGNPPEPFSRFFGLVRKYNIVLKIDMIVGLPLESYDTFFNGLDYLISFLRDSDHVLNIHRLQVLPGTEMEEVVKNHTVNYFQDAPHYVYETEHFSKGEFHRSTQLCAVLFRALNSPLREDFYKCKERSGLPLEELLRWILEEIIKEPAFAKTPLGRGVLIDDEYWNRPIFKDIPSVWLQETMGKVPVGNKE
jgi:radical SAM superfamily enzyme YgiQ (UPF0313 family)